jgi:hypothetical protein
MGIEPSVDGELHQWSLVIHPVTLGFGMTFEGAEKEFTECCLFTSERLIEAGKQGSNRCSRDSQTWNKRDMLLPRQFLRGVSNSHFGPTPFGLSGDVRVTFPEGKGHHLGL